MLQLFLLFSITSVTFLICRSGFKIKAQASFPSSGEVGLMLMCKTDSEAAAARRCNWFSIFYFKSPKTTTIATYHHVEGRLFVLHGEYIFATYTRVQEFEVHRQFGVFHENSLLFIKWIAKCIENIVKTLTRLEIMIFIVYINVVLQTCGSKEGQFYSFSQQHNCFQLCSCKKGLKGFLPLR